MNDFASDYFIKRLVQLNAGYLQGREEIVAHLSASIIPNLDATNILHVDALVSCLERFTDMRPEVVDLSNTAIASIRTAIASGTIVVRTPIPTHLLIGCTEAFDYYNKMTTAAKALNAALPALKRFRDTTKAGLTDMEAMRMTAAMLKT